MKNLRVAVIPTETGIHNIDQSSSVEEILNCELTQLYPLTDYFKAQNDEELPIHWSFLIDIETKEDLTGTNIEGIHMNLKPEKSPFILIHTHRFGTDYHFFKSSKDHTGFYNEEQEFENETLLNKLGVEYEPENNESIEIMKVDNLAEVIDVD